MEIYEYLAEYDQIIRIDKEKCLRFCQVLAEYGQLQHFFYYSSSLMIICKFLFYLNSTFIYPCFNFFRSALITYLLTSKSLSKFTNSNCITFSFITSLKKSPIFYLFSFNVLKMWKFESILFYIYLHYL
jgi:hypothetical protein